MRSSMLLKLALVCGCPLLAHAGTLSVERLYCDYRENPINVDRPQPQLSWRLKSTEPQAEQSAYQILVASSEQLLDVNQPDLWDSGQVQTNRNLHVVYEGQPLQSSCQYFWKVRVWDKQQQAGDYSKPGRWTMGLLNQQDWRARWIAGNPPAATQPIAAGQTQPRLPIFRRAFRIDKPLQRAIVHVCGLGHYELRLNGQRVGDHLYDPGWTNYRRTCLYSSYDITGQLKMGDNAFGMLLGNGMYNVIGGRYVKFLGSFGPPKLILQMRLEYADGTTGELLSDGDWRTAPGPITFSCIYGGEDHDARLEPAGWDAPGFDDSQWSAATLVSGPGGEVLAQSQPHIRLYGIMNPTKVTEPAPGVYVYDLGQNFSGRPSIQVSGSAGATVKLIPAELLNEQGFADQGGSGGPCTFTYTLKGDGQERWTPRFTYYGFRYIQVEGGTRLAEDSASADSRKQTAAASRPVLHDVHGQYTTSSAEVVGNFSCSNTLFNQIHEIITQAIRSNMQSVFTDCPHREKLGWLEETHLMGPAIMYNFHVPLLYRKVFRDIRDSQLDNGLVPDIAPEYTVFDGGFRDSPEWGSAAVFAPWLHYQRYGDISILREHYDCMKRYVDYLTSRSADGIVSHGLGDWFDIGDGPLGPSQLTPIPLTATATYCQAACLLGRISEELGLLQEAAEYAELTRSIARAFHRKFYNAETGQWASGSQTAYAMAGTVAKCEFLSKWVSKNRLKPNGMDANMQLVKELARNAEAIAADIRKRGNHITAGDVGNKYVIDSLVAGGHFDVLHDVANNVEPPSYGFQVRHGATTLTEAWDPRQGFSQNHFMMGHIDEWFYEHVGGIRFGSGAGSNHILIAPKVVGDLVWARAGCDTMNGRVECNWVIDGDRLQVDVIIPPNTDGWVELPGQAVESITEQSESPRAVDRYTDVDNGTIRIQTGSGRYRIVVDRGGRAVQRSQAYKPTQCEGTYPKHLQGICIDGQGAIFWSFTDVLVKTDTAGKVTASVPVANHHGDLCYHDGRLYVAVNLGKFNDPAGNADSWVYVYDADDLTEIARHHIPEVIHGAGGITCRAGRFMVVGGLPPGVEENQVYEYDRDFRLVRKHAINSGYTLMGIQTAEFADGHFWFGCYGVPKILLKTDEAFGMVGRYEFECSLGIAALPDGRFLIARGGSAGQGRHLGRIITARPDAAKGLVVETEGKSTNKPVDK